VQVVQCPTPNVDRWNEGMKTTLVRLNVESTVHLANLPNRE
jgi:hypothetical protein